MQDTIPARRLQLKRRAKRGLVATYIHEISGRRRNGSTARVDKPVEAVPEPANGG